MRLEGKTAIVTGGASGFGAGIVRKFVAEGARVMIADINEAGAEAFAAEMGDQTLAHGVNLVNSNDVEAMAKRAIDIFGGVDILVNNAGITHLPTPLEDVSEDEFDRVLNVNVKSVYLTAKHLVPHMKSRETGAILNVASTAGVSPRPRLSWYNCTKGWMITATRSMAVELAPAGIRVKGRRSTPGRYFQVAEPGTGWGGTDVEDPLTIIRKIEDKAWPGLRLFMVSTTGEQYAYFELDEDLQLVAKDTPEALQASAALIAENCEPSVCSVLFMGGAGGSLRAGVTENPVRLTRSVKDALTYVSCGGAEAYVWPGGGITVMVDVLDMPTNSFGYVPTPALVAPIEFTLRREDYGTLGGHMDHIRKVSDVVNDAVRRVLPAPTQPDPHKAQRSKREGRR